MKLGAIDFFVSSTYAWALTGESQNVALCVSVLDHFPERNSHNNVCMFGFIFPSEQLSRQCVCVWLQHLLMFKLTCSFLVCSAAMETSEPEQVFATKRPRPAQLAGLIMET